MPRPSPIASPPPEAAPQRAEPRSAFIAGPAYDTIFFLAAPWLALAVTFALHRFVFLGDLVFAEVRSDWELKLTVFLGPVLTQAHILLVLFRSHLNRDVFRRHPWRFTVVPLGVFAALLTSAQAFIFARVLGQMWDVYHSSLQTFGFARLYDRKAGNDPKIGRAMDMALAHVIYIGPALAGVNLIYLLSYFSEFEAVGWKALSQVPMLVLPLGGKIRDTIVVGTALFLVAYVAYFTVLRLRGYRISIPKMVLLVGTALASVLSWGYLPAAACILAINFFHAWQYFGIVWWSERGNLQARFRLGRGLAALLLIGASFGYALANQKWGTGLRWLGSFALTCSLMHFWWDGFIWSVRKGHV